MEDLTIILQSDLKKDIFNLCNTLNPTHLQVEPSSVEAYHIYHALKVSKWSDDHYTIKDMSKDKPSEVTNKFLLYKVKEQLLQDLDSVVKQEEEEKDVEAFSDTLIGIDGEPVHSEIEEAEEILKEASILNDEVQDENPIM